MRKMETSHNKFSCHNGTSYEVATIPCEPFNFLSCGEDGTVRWFDLRIKDKCNNYRCTEVLQYVFYFYSFYNCKFLL
jgi:nuclear receptor interaction protein